MSAPPAPRFAFPLLCAATLAEFVTMGMFLAALPLFLDDELGASRAAIGVVIAAFSVSALLLRPVVGRQADRRGRRRFLVAAPIVLMVSSLGLLAAGSLLAVGALRVLQGVAGAAFYTAAATMATDLAPPARRAEYIARLSLFIYGGFAVGPSIAEAIVGRGGGFGAVWLATGASAGIALLCALALPETLSERSAGTTPFRLFHPASLAPGLVLVTVAVGYSTVSTFSPLYARSIGMPSSGPLYLAFALTIMGVRLFSGRLADRYGRLNVALPGMLLAVVGMATLAATPEPAFAVAGVACFGAGFAVVFPALMALTDDRVDARERGEALGSTVAFFDIGASAGGVAVGAVADRAGFGPALLTPAALALAGALGLFNLRARDRRSTPPAEEPPLPEPAGA